MFSSKNLTTTHPRALYLLFFTELWERFGYYMVQTLLVLYLSKALGFTDARAYLTVGTYGALIYLTPAFGGWLADHFLGRRLAIIIGGIIFTIGYVLTSIPNENVFFFALSFLIIGNGFFKPSVSSIVGDLYEKDDPRRQSGFTIFYMGMNIGSAIPPLCSGFLLAHIGWHLGFLTAAFGMLIGLLIFTLNQKKLNGLGGIPKTSPLLKGVGQRNWFAIKLSLATTLALLLLRGCFMFPNIVTYVVIAISALVILFVLFKILRLAGSYRANMFAAILLIVISIGFWALYNQMFSSFLLFAERSIDLHFLGFKVDASFIIFFGPLFIVLLSPFVSKLWLKLAEKNINPSLPTKFLLAMIFTALSFMVIAIACRYFGIDHKISIWWMVLCFFLLTIAELLISPIGLSMITELCHEKMIGLMMGVWFLSSTAGFALSGKLATLAAIPKAEQGIDALLVYGKAFTHLSELALGLVLASAVIVILVRKLLR